MPATLIGVLLGIAGLIAVLAFVWSRSGGRPDRP